MGTKAEFDKYASDYDGLLRDPVRDLLVDNREFYHRRKWLLILNFLQPSTPCLSKMEWLDVGSGKAELLGYGSGHFGRVAGCDPSSEMVRDAEKLEMRLPGKTAIPIPPRRQVSMAAASGLCIACRRVRTNITREVQRVLRPNGIFCMIEHNPFNPMTRFIVARSPIDVDAHLPPAASTSTGIIHDCRSAGHGDRIFSVSSGEVLRQGAEI